ncbi:hypothetical protein BJ741DRAFT_622700 [Chytriomyces cf. hyalinus JEL632]|nr:hypothetical protein BJ741DRAFT_622700 [Chytriomyces cf. hyalinus JEL632]
MSYVMPSLGSQPTTNTNNLANDPLALGQVGRPAQQQPPRRKSNADTSRQLPPTPTVQTSFQLPAPTHSSNDAKPLFQRCIHLIAQLYPFPLFEFYLFPDGIDAYMIPSMDGGLLPVIADPVDVLWNCFKLGAPLCVIYNELAKTTTGVFLNVDDVSGIRAPFYPTKPCKDNLYKFITACRSEIKMPQAQELSGVSELYKDDTSGFMKFLKLVEELIIRIDAAGNTPEPKPLPFSTELSKELTNPLDNRARVIKELVETERAYIFSLEELQRYQNELASSKVFSKDMMSQLFSNLNELLDFQRRFMVGMESTLNLGVAEQRIGQLFILNEEAFEVYYPFCGNYENASDFVLNRGEELKHMGHIIQPHNITAYLIQPLQRLMRYALLLKELIKHTDADAYPYTDELKDGLDAIKRVTERLNEVQRKVDNERVKQDLMERLEDWKGLQIRDFGDLLLCEKFPIASNEQEREYHLFLFERILLCCKKDLKAVTKRASSRKQSNAGKEAASYSYILRGNIYISSIVRVEDMSDTEFKIFSIRVYWKDVSEPDTVCFSLKCRNEEQVSLWTDRLEKQVEIYQRRRKNSGAVPMSPHQQGMLGHRGSDGFSSIMTGTTMYDPNYAASIMSSQGSQYGGARMMRSMSNPNNQMYGQMMSPVSPGGPNGPQYGQQYRQGSSYDPYAQQQFYMDGAIQSGLNSSMISIPTGGQGQRMSNERGMATSRSQPGQPYNPNMYNQAAPPMPTSSMRGPNSMAYAVGPDGRPVPSRMDSMSSQQSSVVGRRPSTKGQSAQSVSKSREALNALASLAASGLPIAGFSDDEDSEEGVEEDEEAHGSLFHRGVANGDIARQMQAIQLQNSRKQSTANGMMMGTYPADVQGSMNGRRPSNDRGYTNYSQDLGMRKASSEVGYQYTTPTGTVVNGRMGSTDASYNQGMNARSSPIPPSNQLLPNGYQRKSSGFAGDRNSPIPMGNAPYQFPQPQSPSMLQQHMQQQQFRVSGGSQFSGAPRSPNSPGYTPVSPGGEHNMAMRRTPTAPSYLSTSNSSQPSSFIKIRTHYDGDILIIAMPVRGATLQELRNRVDRKVNMMPHKPMLSTPIRMTVKEEVATDAGGKEWKVIRTLETDEDVAMSFTTNAGFLNLFLA